jgi:uroporphyrinogen decarboxylase
VRAGADLLQLFDSWAGILSPAQYAEFSAPYIKAICEAIHDVPKTIFAKGAFFALSDFAHMPCQVIGLDWNMDPATSRATIGRDKTLQGNLDPCALYASPREVAKATREMIDAFGTGRHIANLGHGVYPDVNPDHVKVFVETVKAYSAEKTAAR